jgi:hypothetical protein
MRRGATQTWAVGSMARSVRPAAAAPRETRPAWAQAEARPASGWSPGLYLYRHQLYVWVDT